MMMDGPAPRAKLITQRIRRADRAAKKQKTEIDTTQLSPGTPMMARVRRAVLYLIYARLQSKQWSDVAFFFSGPEVPGEGETKVQERLLAHAAAEPSDTHCCFGSDADLIVQCMAATAHKVSVCLNFQHADQLLDIGKLVQKIFGQRPGDNVKQPASLTDVELSSARGDFALLSLFMGNDYLPAVKTGEMKRVLPIYLKLRKGFRKRSLVIVENDGTVKIDWGMLSELIKRCTIRGKGSKEKLESVDESDSSQDETPLPKPEPEPEPELELEPAAKADGVDDDDLDEEEIVMFQPKAPVKSATGKLMMPLFLPPKKATQEPERAPEPQPEPEPEPEPAPVAKNPTKASKKAAAEAELVRDYLHGLLWNVTMIRTGVCDDYNYAFAGGGARSGVAPTFAQIGSFLMHRKSELSTFDPRQGSRTAEALSPLQFCLAVMPLSSKGSLSSALQSVMDDETVADIFTDLSLDVTSEKVAARLAAALAKVPPAAYTEEDAVWKMQQEEAYYSRHGDASLSIKLPPPPGPNFAKLREKKDSSIKRYVHSTPRSGIPAGAKPKTKAKKPAATNDDPVSAVESARKERADKIEAKQTSIRQKVMYTATHTAWKGTFEIMYALPPPPRGSQ